MVKFTAAAATRNHCRRTLLPSTFKQRAEISSVQRPDRSKPMFYVAAVTITERLCSFSYRLLKYVSDFVAVGFMNGIVFHS
jgi:hypothetical protein